MEQIKKENIIVYDMNTFDQIVDVWIEQIKLLERKKKILKIQNKKH